MMSINKWSNHTIELAKKLHEDVRIKESDWHRYKNQPDKRAAELLAAAISQLINSNSSSDVQPLVEHALLWIKGELKDPGCPRK